MNQLLCLNHDRLCGSIFLRRRTKEQNLRENVHQLLNTVWRMLITCILYIFALLNFPQIHNSPQSNYNDCHDQLQKKEEKKNRKEAKERGNFNASNKRNDFIKFIGAYIVAGD